MKNWQKLVSLVLFIAASIVFWMTVYGSVATPVLVLFIAATVAAPIYLVYLLIDWVFPHHPYKKKLWMAFFIAVIPMLVFAYKFSSHMAQQG
jgi:hypothetical protein